MCGIVGIIGNRQAAPLLLDGLRRLEYRGYDSAGIATLVNGKIDTRRAKGKLDSLAARLHEQPLSGTVGIGHTVGQHTASQRKPMHTLTHRQVAVVHNASSKITVPYVKNWKPKAIASPRKPTPKA